MRSAPLVSVRASACASALALVIVSAATACAPAPPAAPAATAEGVRAAYEAFEAAWMNEDFDGAAGVFTADAVVIDPVPPYKFVGSEEIGGWVTRAFDSLEGVQIAAEEIQVKTEGPVAWMVGQFRFTAESAEGPVDDSGYLSMVWRLQEDGSYKAELFHAMNLPPAEENEAEAGAESESGS